MLTKEDLVLLLTDLQDLGVEVQTSTFTKVLTSTNIPLDILKFINDNRQLAVADFYNHLRINYNKKKSDLYMNIVKEVSDPNEAITTLAAFILQAFLFSKQLEDKDLFLKHVRLEEATRVLNNYVKTYDLTEALTLLRLIKADLKAFESIK